MGRSLKTITIIFLGLLMLSNISVIGYLVRAAQRSDTQIAATMASNDRLSKQISPLGSLIKDAHIDVVQVQQFLQDYSSTRGEDGLTDGLDEAAKFAAKFRADVAAATAIAKAVRRDDLIATLNAAADAFGPYFEAGERMAKVYAAEGTKAGNAMMPAFDESSEALQEKIKALLAIRDELLATTSTEVAAELTALESDLSTSSATSIAAAGFVVVISLAWAWVALRHIVRPIVTLSEVLQGLAAGRLGIAVPFVGARNEIGDIARATDVFRDSIAQRERQRQEAAREDERSRQERRRERLALADEFADRVATVMDGLGVAAERIGHDARAEIGRAHV